MINYMIIISSKPWTRIIQNANKIVAGLEKW